MIKCLRCSSEMKEYGDGKIPSNKIMNLKCYVGKLYICNSCGYSEINFANCEDSD